MMCRLMLRQAEYINLEQNRIARLVSVLFLTFEVQVNKY